MEEASAKPRSRICERFGGSVHSRASAPCQRQHQRSGFKVCNGIRKCARRSRVLGTHATEQARSTAHSCNTDKVRLRSMSMWGISRPGRISGLAHFCEHMLFLGGEISDENSYSAFLNEHGGSSMDLDGKHKLLFRCHAPHLLMRSIALRNSSWRHRSLRARPAD